VDESRHLRLALLLVAVFLASGLWLEAMFALRERGWMDDDLRREFLRLGHAHGGLLGLVNIALSFAMHRLATPPLWARRIRVAALSGALLVAFGFFGGGLWHGQTDPGPLVLVVPAGAMLVFASLIAVALVRAGE
jgi:hypothetical protein